MKGSINLGTDKVKLEYDNHIAVIRINRPDKMNAINLDVVEGLKEAKAKIESEDQIRTVILTGAGDRAFSAGADINELSREDGRMREAREEPSYIIYKISKPVIAMVNGYALGGGFELALACDLITASEKAIFAFPEITMGWLPGGGGTQILSRKIPHNISMEVLLTGKKISGEKAKRYGLVNHIYQDKDLLEKTFFLAKQISSNSLLALKYIKDAVRRSSYLDIETGFAYEKKLLGLCFYSSEKKEGVDRFLNKS